MSTDPTNCSTAIRGYTTPKTGESKGLLCSRAPDLSRSTHEARGIHLEPADPDLLQVENQGIELAKNSELFAALGGQGSFG